MTVELYTLYDEGAQAVGHVFYELWCNIAERPEECSVLKDCDAVVKAFVGAIRAAQQLGMSDHDLLAKSGQLFAGQGLDQASREYYGYTIPEAPATKMEIPVEDDPQ